MTNLKGMEALGERRDLDRDKGLREKLVKESTIQNEKSFRLRKPSQKYNQASGVELL